VDSSGGGPAFLVPAFDEYYKAYKDRSALLDRIDSREFNLGGAAVNGAIGVDGRIIRRWNRTVGDGGVTPRHEFAKKTRSLGGRVSSRRRSSTANLLVCRFLSSRCNAGPCQAPCAWLPALC